MAKKNLVILSGAGISTESGISTFRDSDGLWENHRIEEVASPEGFKKNPTLVLDFYNKRRAQLKSVEPNDAHRILAELQEFFHVEIITQNVDDLHERAGSEKVLYLHGELKKVRSLADSTKIYPWENDLTGEDLDETGNKMRPHIVWFGEDVPEIENAKNLVKKADFLVIIGTSLQIYPAAGLMNYAPKTCEIFVIDPNLPVEFRNSENAFAMGASEGMKKLKEILISKIQSK